MPPKPKISPVQAQEKIDADLRKISRIEGNRTCVDCPEKMPGYINLTHCTFVCIKCSGIHRELQHKIKGISMSVFTAEDVVNLSAGGNVALNLMYMNRFQSIDYALPTGSDIGKLREFIKRKYIEKKWYTDESSRVSRPVPSSSSSAHCAQGDPRALQKLGPIPTNIVKGVTNITGRACVDLMSMSPMSPTQSCSPYPKGSSDPFGVQSPTMRTSYNGSNMEHQMRFDAFNSPVIQHHSGHPSPSLNPSATASATASAGVATDAAIRASESRSDKANSNSIHLNSSSLPASSQSNPVHPGSSNMPLQGSALYSPSLPVQSRISANPFDQPTSIIFGGGDMKSFSCPGVPAPALYGDLAHPQSQYPNPSYPLAMPYSQSPGPGTGPTPGPGYMMGPGSIPRQNQGPSPGSGPGPGLSHQQGMTQPQLYSPQQHQHQYQQQQLQQRNFDQRQYQMNQPVSYDAASGLPQGQRPPNLTTPGAGFTVLLSPGPLRAPAPVDPFSSVDALSWGLGVKKIDPYAPLDATPQSVTYSPSYTREQPRKASEMYRHTHTQTMQLVTPLPAVVNESTNPFDLY